MKALLLVDIQNDFLPDGALSVPRGNEILPIVQQILLHPFDLIVATKDWHPLNHASFATTHNKTPGEKIILGEREQILWPVHCVQETEGAAFPPNWDTTKIEKVFYKGTDKTTDSYSAFFDNNHNRSTGLDHYLRQRNIKDLYIAGLATDYCVKFSALDALELGFNVFIVTDACRGVDLKTGNSAQALQEMKQKGAHLTTSKEIQ